MKAMLFGLASALAAASFACAQSANMTGEEIAGLPRQADLGFRASTQDGALVVARLDAASQAAAAGLRDGDVIVRVNGARFARPHEGHALLIRLNGGAPVRMDVERDGRGQAISFIPNARPLESLTGVASVYGMVETPDGARLRTIITKPEGAEDPLHPLLFTQWVSCGSIEFRGPDSVLAKLARNSGLALVRVERSGAGDSEGPACHELDYDTEVSHYIHAFDELLQSEDIDASQVYIFGSSLGSTTAPLVARALEARGYDIAGVAVQGGGAETYYERMLTFDRLYLERRPDDVDPADIHGELLRRARFHYEYLINDRDPDEIAQDSDAMAAARADIRGLGAGEHYGRPFAWHQQAAKRNFLAAWTALDADVLVIFNAFDQFEARYGHKLIADMVNRKRPGAATYVEQANVGHSDYRYASIEDAYLDVGGVNVWEQTADVILTWLNDIRWR